MPAKPTGEKIHIGDAVYLDTNSGGVKLYRGEPRGGVLCFYAERDYEKGEAMEVPLDKLLTEKPEC